MCRKIIRGMESDNVTFDVVFTVGLPDRHAGITLEDTRGGVRVKALHPRDEAAKYFCRGDVIRNVNGFPAVHHRDVIAIINSVTASGGVLRFARGQDHPRRIRSLRASAISFHAEHDAWNAGHTNGVDRSQIP